MGRISHPLGSIESFTYLGLISFCRYMKYLFPYEYEKRRLSTPAELQAAIDGNRHGRRSSYGSYNEMVHPTRSLNFLQKKIHLKRLFFNYLNILQEIF